MKKSFLSLKQTMRIGITALALGAFAFFSQMGDFRLWNGIDTKAETGYTISYNVSQNNLPEDIGGVRLATSRFTTLQFDGFQSGSSNYATLESSASSGFFNRHSIKGMTSISFVIDSAKADVYLTFASPGTETVADADGIKQHASAVVLSALPSATSFSYTDSYYLQAYDYFFVSFPTGTDIVSIEITYSCVEPESASPVAIVVEGNVGAVVGTDQSYQALVYPIGSTKTVTWSLQNAVIAGTRPSTTFATINSSTGVLTPVAADTANAGTVIIKATSTADSNVFGIFEVKICASVVSVTTNDGLKTALNNTSNNNRYVKLMNDLDGTGFTYTGNTQAFGGVLDGNGFTISNITITAGNTGLIFNSRGSAITNLKINNANLTPSSGNFSLIFGQATPGFSTLVHDVIITNATMTLNSNQSNGAFLYGNWSWSSNSNGGRIRISNFYLQGSVVFNISSGPYGIGVLFGSTYFGSTQTTADGHYPRPAEIVNSYINVAFSGSNTSSNFNTAIIAGYMALGVSVNNLYVSASFTSGYTQKSLDIGNTNAVSSSSNFLAISNATTTRLGATILTNQSNVTSTHTNPFVNSYRSPWSVDQSDSTKLQLTIRNIKYPA